MKKILFCLLMIGLVSCSPKTVPLKEHESGASANDVPHAETQPKPLKAVSGLDLNELVTNRLEVVNDIKQGKRLELAAQLTPVILTEEFVSGAEASDEARDSRLRLLSIYQTALLQNLKLNRDDPKTLELAEQFSDFALQGCDDQDQNCDYLEYFSKAPLTSDIFFELIKLAEPKLQAAIQQKAAFSDQLHLHYQKFRLGVLAGRNRTPNDEEPLSYLRFASEYSKSLTGQSRYQAIARTHHQRVLTLIQELAQKKHSPQHRKLYCDYVMELNPVTSRTAAVQFGPMAVPALISKFVECTSERRQLRQFVVGLIDKQKMAAEDESKLASASEANWATVRKTLREKPHVLRAMNVENRDIDPYIQFLLTNVYYETLPITAVQEFLKAPEVRIDDQELIKAAQIFVQSQVAFLMIRTQAVMAQQMREQYVKQKGLNASFFTETFKETNQATHFSWRKLKPRVNLVKEFITRSLEEKYNSITKDSLDEKGKATEAALKTFKTQLDNNKVSENLIYASPYPLYLPISYYMSRANGPVRILLPWWSEYLSIEGKGAINNFIDEGKGFQQFFNYGDVLRKLEPIQTTYLLDVALRSGLFETIPFDLVKDEGETFRSNAAEYLFFKRYLYETLQDQQKSLNESLVRLERLQSSEDYKTFLNLTCKNPFTAPVSLDLSALMYGTIRTNHLISGIYDQLYSADIPTASIKKTRLKAEKVYKIFEDHFMTEGAESRLSSSKFETREEILKAMRDELDAYTAVERKFNTKWVELDSEISNAKRDCAERLARVDLYRRYKLYDLNITFYLDVHAAMTTMRMADLLTETDTPEAFLNLLRLSINQMKNREVAGRILNLLARVESSGLWQFHHKFLPISRLQRSLNDLLSIHNSNTAPFLNTDQNGRIISEVGYFVEGTDVVANPYVDVDSKVLKRNNSIRPDRFIQSRWDSLIRVRRQMQTTLIPIAEANDVVPLENILPERTAPGMMRFAPKVEIPLQSISEMQTGNSYFKDEIRHTVEYDENPEVFLASAMMQFGGWHKAGGGEGDQHVSWNTSSNDVIAGMQRRLNALFNIHRSPMEISSDTTCARDVWDRPVNDGKCKLHTVRPAQILRYFTQWTDLLNLNEKDRYYLQYLRWNNRLGSTASMYFSYKDDPTTNRWTYFDRLYLMKYSCSMSFEPNNQKFSESIEGGWEFKEFERELMGKLFKDEDHLMPLNQTFFNRQRHIRRQKMMQHLLAVREFEVDVETIENDVLRSHMMGENILLPDIVFERQEGSLRQDENYVFGNYRVMKVLERTSGPRAGTPIYLNDGSGGSRYQFWSFVTRFNAEEVNCLFLPRKGEPDYIESSTATGSEGQECSARFAEWKKINLGL